MAKKPVLSDEESILREAWGDALFAKVKERLDGAVAIPTANKSVQPEVEKPLSPATAKPVDIRREDLIGQTEAKAALDQVISVARLNLERRARNLPPFQITMHAVFAGSPGTGKTTFARFYAQEIKRLGVLKSGHLVEVSRSDLVAEFAGQTAGKTHAMVQKARGGVLFVDEAYALKNSKDDAFGQECIDTLVKYIEDYRDDLIVILAGYTDEMRGFLHTNTGLKSRIPHFIEFGDYSDDQLGLIFDSMLKKIGLTVAPENRAFLIREIAQKRRARSFGNAREVRNLLERALSQQAVRLNGKDLKTLSESELVTLIYSDFTESSNDQGLLPPAEAEHTAIKRLESLTGLASVKAEIKKLADFLKVSQKRSGGKPVDGLNLHMVFSGNPGTGKSTVARLLGEIFRELGVLGSGHLVEADRSNLVAAYQGQTAIKTREILNEALGGVLFVDEAYTLARGDTFGGTDAYGQEAIDTLLKAMEDFRGKVAVVFAGYPEPMTAFMQSNPGLKSRIGNVLEFADFTMDELIAIARDFASGAGFTLSPGGEKALRDLLAQRKSDPRTFGNARDARNLLESAFKRQAQRLLSGKDIALLTAEELAVLESADFE